MVPYRCELVIETSLLPRPGCDYFARRERRAPAIKSQYGA
jgi:hypothetical protein